MGWKDILRPIRDGYRHLFPTPDTGPSAEERRKRRDVDRLKGFAYFDTFEQLETWDVTTSDPLQRANTPLLPRCTDIDSAQETKANVLICHDYAGNYHDYESVQEVGQNDEMYNCEYLQYVDTFVYFSHKLVCVPPPTWVNTLHRNGVKALGTILVEPQTKDTERLLLRDDRKFILANILADIAKHYGFDGYLVNIEKPFPKDSWTLEALQAFLVQLRDNLGERMHLVWSAHSSREMPKTDSSQVRCTDHFQRDTVPERLDQVQHMLCRSVR
jgi:endo-beta-N-acetylglucosaminidase D